jgi:hypothetical protein
MEEAKSRLNLINYIKDHLINIHDDAINQIHNNMIDIIKNKNIRDNKNDITRYDKVVFIENNLKYMSKQDLEVIKEIIVENAINDEDNENNKDNIHHMISEIFKRVTTCPSNSTIIQEANNSGKKKKIT